jgi:hypothetical protein
MTTRRLVRIAIGVWIVAILLSVYPYLLQSHRLTLTVTENDAASECRSQSSLLSGFGQYRSSTPKYDYDGYCGTIRTDSGFYLLPDAGRFDWLDQDRADLDAKLQPGCRFEVTIVGPGGLQNPDQPRAPIVQKISRIHQELGCGVPVD